MADKKLNNHGLMRSFLSGFSIATWVFIPKISQAFTAKTSQDILSNPSPSSDFSEYRVRGGVAPPSAHRTVRTGPYTAPQDRCTHLDTSNQ